MVGLVVCSVTWWSIMPHGFPMTSPRFWVNEVAPWISVSGASSAIALRWTGSRWFAACSYGLAGGAVGLAVTFRLLFEQSADEIWLAPFVFGGLLVAAAYMTNRDATRKTFLPLSAMLLGASVGSLLVWSQRAPLPGTMPRGGAELHALKKTNSADGGWNEFSPEMSVQTTLARVRIKIGTIKVEIDPLLQFESRSPDRMWVLFSPSSMLLPPARRLLEAERTSHAFWGKYGGIEPAALQVRARPSDQTLGQFVKIEAVTDVPNAVYSHLNSFALVSISGHQEIELGFSPHPEQRFTVKPYDYPEGRPIQFAYLNAKGEFQVAIASNGEKGPFRVLASGPVDRDQTLEIVIYDAGEPAFSVRLEDWLAQASTALSPTAGWGIPTNGIEFYREDDRPGSTVTISFTLASTSVGRGFDTVGHSPGRYRNRMTIGFWRDTPSVQ